MYFIDNWFGIHDKILEAINFISSVPEEFSSIFYFDILKKKLEENSDQLHLRFHLINFCYAQMKQDTRWK